MPKMKTKSGAKKRFKITASGLVCSTQANKQHNMRKRSKRQLRNNRGTTILNVVETKRALAYFPYRGKKKRHSDLCYLSTLELEQLIKEMESQNGEGVVADQIAAA